MIVVYCLMAFLLTYTIFKYYFNKEVKIHKFFRILLKLLTTVIMLFSIIIILAMPVPKLLKNTGEYPISSFNLKMIDEVRTEIYTEEEQDVRELMVTIWYPSEETKSVVNKPYISNLNMFGSTLTKELEMPSFLFDYFDCIKTQVTVGAPVSNQSDQYPLLIFSHGLGTISELYTSIITELVSNGYVVASVNHTYSTMATVFPGEGVTTFKTDVEKYSEEQLTVLEETWVKDIEFVLTQMDHLNAGIDNGVLKDRIDMSKIGVIGHSFGGEAAYQACYSNDRISVGINLDGSIYSINPKVPIKDKCFMLMASEEYAAAIESSNSGVQDYDELSASQQLELEKQGRTKQQYEESARQMKFANSFFKEILDQGSIYISIDGTKHYNFSDAPLISPLTKMMGLTGEIDGKRGLKIINAYTVQFFNEHLKNMQGSLLNGPTKEYPEVKFEGIQ
ncbi:MAG TPA: hypothetical protein VJ888_03245 [Mobilitalea sp.]|nr:hypothetical protein [Mobilitalea sp.]